MTEWRDMTLGEVCELKRGYDLPRGARGDGSVPVVSSSGTTGWHDEAKVKAPGVVTGRYGTLGQVFYVTEDFWPLNTSLYVRDFKGNDPQFVAALLRSLNLATYDGAAAVPGLNRNQLHTLPVRVPGVSVQKAIAGVAQIFDDLVQNNLQQVNVLEEMARAIYREWFVKFRFPARDGVGFIESTVGRIPKGWKVRSIGETAVNWDRKRRPLSKMQRQLRPGDYPYYGAAKLIDWIDDWIFDGEHLLFAEDGSVQTADGFPFLQLVDEKFWANNHTHVLRGDSVSTRFLFLACERLPIGGYVTGAAQPKITQANLNRIPLVVGPPELHTAFDRLIDPLFDHARNLKNQVAALESIQKLLIPKLIAGKIDVSSLDLDALIGEQVA